MTPYQAVVGARQEQEQPVEQNVVAVQAKNDWLSSTLTQRIFKDIIKQSDGLVADAISLSRVNHQSDNSKQIIHKLIEADSLRKVVEKYGR